MTNREIYVGALELLSERADGEENADYEERAPYLIATFCNESARLDAAWRTLHGLAEAEPCAVLCVDMNEEFPCCPRLTGAACAYLASMLVLDENERLSDRLYHRYSDIMATICSELPAPIERIVERY